MEMSSIAMITHLLLRKIWLDSPRIWRLRGFPLTNCVCAWGAAAGSIQIKDCHGSFPPSHRQTPRFCLSYSAETQPHWTYHHILMNATKPFRLCLAHTHTTLYYYIIHMQLYKMQWHQRTQNYHQHYNNHKVLYHYVRLATWSHDTIQLT